MIFDADIRLKLPARILNLPERTNRKTFHSIPFRACTGLSEFSMLFLAKTSQMKDAIFAMKIFL
jgi:hypothetical protein